MGRKRAKIGDVIEIAMPAGFAYAQLIHRDRLLGCMVRVLPGIHHARLSDLSAQVLSQEQYYIFLFEDDLHVKAITKVVAHEPVPERCRSYPLFRAGVRDPKTGKVATWWLWNGEKSWPVGDLTAEHRKLSVREIWNYKILVDRITSGWHPNDVT